jgi:tetratricopeptide (TPR) repeat protein
MSLRKLPTALPRLALTLLAALPTGLALSDGAAAAPAIPRAEPSGVARELALAESAFQAGDFAQAELQFRKIIEVHGDEPNAWLRIGLIQQRRHAFKAALSAYDSALSCAAADTDSSQVFAKVRFNRALLLLESAAQDLRGIRPGVLAESLDLTRETLAAHVEAALRSAGSAGPAEPPTSAAAASSALGYVYEVKRPVAPVAPIGEPH